MKVTKFACMACALGVLLLSISSCNKEKDQTTTFNISTPEWQSDEDERVYIDFTLYRQYWNAFDQVMVYNLDFDNPGNSVCDVFSTGASAEGKPGASFTGSVGAKKDGYFTFYPASMAGCHEGALDMFNDQNRDEFEVPALQNLTSFTKNGIQVSTIDPMAVVMAHNPSSLKSFTFQYIFGMLKLSLAGDNGLVIDRIELVDNFHNLAGKVSVKLDNVDTQQLEQLINFVKTDQTDSPEFANLMMNYVLNPNGGLGYDNNYPGHTNTLTLNCSNVNHPELRTLLGENQQLITMYLGIRPGALDKGFALKIYFEGDEAVYISQFMGSNPLKCSKPGKIRVIEPAFLTPSNYTGIGQPLSYGVWGDWVTIENM